MPPVLVVRVRVTAKRFELAALIALLLPAMSASAQVIQAHTVLDFYRLLPDKFFEADKQQRIDWMLDRKRGAIVDNKNGYIFAPGDGAQSDLYLALFRKTDGRSVVVGVKHYAPDTQDITYLEFYVVGGNTWTEVTKSVMPVKISEHLKYDLPRHGRIIRVSNRRGRLLYYLIWSGERFRLRRQ